MARRQGPIMKDGKFNSKMTKAEDTHRFLRFVINHTGTGEDNHYLDISQILSQINRRMYRQGGTYHIANISVHDSAGDAYVKFAGLPSTWTSKAAWSRGFDLWKAQRSMVQADGSQLTGKWSDFKVYLNDDHRTDTDKLAFKDIDDGGIATGEWDYADLILQDDDNVGTDAFYLHMMGANNGNLSAGTCVSAGLLSALEDSLAKVQEDPTPSANVSTGLFSLAVRQGQSTELIQDMIDIVEDDNNNPPYSQTLVPGARTNCADPWMFRDVAIKTSQAPQRLIPGFPVPLGLLMIETKSATDGNLIGLCIELVPGPYKGVAFDSWA